MSLLTWNFNKNFIYVIIYWILEIIYHIIFAKNSKFLKMTKDYIQNEFIFVILCNILDLLSGFFILYSKCASKSKKIENENIRAKSQSELSSVKSDNPNKKFCMKLIIVAILDYISRSSTWISYAITKVESKIISHSLQKNIKLTLDIIMRYIFSVFILNVIVYKHRIFSMVTISIVLAILIINDIILMSLDTSINMTLEKLFILLPLNH